MTDIRTSLLSGVSAKQLVDEHGLSSVTAEISDMAYGDMADKALRAAINLGDKSLISISAGVVLRGEEYDEDSKRLARNYVPSMDQVPQTG